MPRFFILDMYNITVFVVIISNSGLRTTELPNDAVYRTDLRESKKI